MPDINVKSFNVKAVMPEKMADGVDVHNGEEDFPIILKEELLRKTWKNFQSLRD
jgi:hypothetical protein